MNSNIITVLRFNITKGLYSRMSMLSALERNFKDLSFQTCCHTAMCFFPNIDSVIANIKLLCDLKAILYSIFLKYQIEEIAITL